MWLGIDVFECSQDVYSPVRLRHSQEMVMISQYRI